MKKNYFWMISIVLFVIACAFELSALREVARISEYHRKDTLNGIIFVWENSSWMKIAVGCYIASILAGCGSTIVEGIGQFTSMTLGKFIAAPLFVIYLEAKNDIIDLSRWSDLICEVSMLFLLACLIVATPIVALIVTVDLRSKGTKKNTAPITK